MRKHEQAVKEKKTRVILTISIHQTRFRSMGFHIIENLHDQDERKSKKLGNRNMLVTFYIQLNRKIEMGQLVSGNFAIEKFVSL
mmetsp:Transcript_14307/g.35920  ORF Transcript_14307/g.35920 Transcript_14307/m.35920 type:complete len:84 (+) Transcript_14307:1092-1343(+)